jgi:hypothetical protein
MPLSATDKLLLEPFENPPREMKTERYEPLHTSVKKLALLILELIPDGKERERALSQLEGILVWSGAAIQRGEVG